jgi:hypothetical protein
LPSPNAPRLRPTAPSHKESAFPFFARPVEPGIFSFNPSKRPFVAISCRLRRPYAKVPPSFDGGTMFGFLLWLLLLFLCWPLALIALVLYPLVWLLLLPFRLLGIGVNAVFEFLKAVVMLPARVLGGGPGR